MSSIIDWKDRATCVLFGDGAGAAVLKRSRPDPSGARPKGVLSTYLRTDGKLADLLVRPGGGATIPFSEQVLADGEVHEGPDASVKHAVRSMADATDRALDIAKLTGNDIGLLSPPGEHAIMRRRQSTPPSRWTRCT
jgi:3-oxoacyl-[acyl-carrier-protein] synthase-3